jgi:hypothetical protein
MADYLLLETGDKLILEDASGNLLLESSAGEVEPLWARLSISMPVFLFIVLRELGGDLS